MTSHLRRALSCALAAAGALGLYAAAPARAADPEPIKIGVISEQSAIVGQAILQGAQLAAEDINAKGGVNGRKIEIVSYDDHSSASDAVRAYQRAVQQDHVSAVVATFISEVALAIEPWAARLHMPTITPAAASDLISKQVHDKYDQYKYMFEGWFPSPILARATCDASGDLFVKDLHMKTAAIVSEDADWTKPLDDGTAVCLPKVGLTVVDHVRFNPDTTDFTPIYNSIEAKHPNVIITGIAHVGVQPTVQWHDQQVPIPLGGISAQATNLTFWKDTNGAANGVVTQTGTVPGLAITPLTLPVADAFQKRFGHFPAFDGFTAYDAVRAFAGAIARAKSTDPDKMVAEMEKTDMEGTLGHVAFYGRQDQFTHALKYGPGFVTPVVMQWQDGKQVCVWPSDKCPAKMIFPSFVKVQQAANQ
ncbi:MAG TPA: ABC transporter substrate-binding protein [Acetobacteraceae bacterium]|jgi:branched-chain amino acid transport system substrate-binding protein|nr:ABC transporter substrate-binding protein [Acetobacteraceae bacterium]